MTSYLKFVSDSTADAFFYWKGHHEGQKYLQFEIISLFELIQIEVQCSKNYFKISLPQEARASGNKK